MSNNINKQRRIAIPPPSPSLTDKKLYFSYGSGFSLRTGSKLSSGFTIIEVALVLAIAGLIFLVVFLALPALQKSQKDMAARQDIGRIVSALQIYKTDNNGALPPSESYSPSASIGFSRYFGGKLSQITSVWISTVGSGYGVNPNTRTSNVIVGSLCPGDTRTPTSSDAAVNVMLSSGKPYCQSLQ